MALGVLTAITLFASYPLLDAPPERVREPGLVFYRPLHADRPLDLGLLEWPWVEKRSGPLGWRLGLVASQARGRIRQTDPTGAAYWLDSPAWGLGPQAEVRWRWPVGDGVALGWTLSAALQLHDRDFPSGGRRYNGLFQTGPLLTLDGVGCHLGWRVSHLSNGRGLGPDNPAYEGQGWALGCRWPL